MLTPVKKTVWTRTAMNFCKPRQYLVADGGIAAIETALLLPVLIFLYVGMIDITAMITANRKVTMSASILADLTTQQQNTVTSAQIDDFFNSTAIVMREAGSSTLTPANADIRDYQVTVTNATTGTFTISQRWIKKKGAGCNDTPSTAELTPLMVQKDSANKIVSTNDVVVATVCNKFSPYVATFLGSNLIGQTSFSLSEQIIARPRTSDTLVLN